MGDSPAKPATGKRKDAGSFIGYFVYLQLDQPAGTHRKRIHPDHGGHVVPTEIRSHFHGAAPGVSTSAEGAYQGGRKDLPDLFTQKGAHPGRLSRANGDNFHTANLFLMLEISGHAVLLRPERVQLPGAGSLLFRFLTLNFEL
jgi:hypothetical protein